ncbi:MAG: pyrimidine reductase family protein [Rhodococcus sp.]|nr:pyrimidine reductase family protein [Rhodococcus sp. (in: high G+C Gram-positive bacteria)]
MNHVRLIHNATHITQGDLTHAELLQLYAYPAADHPWVRVNFVTSIDGQITVDGTSGGLGTPADKTVFSVLRELPDVVVVGAGTVRAENYGGVHYDDGVKARRFAGGQAPTPPIAVVSAHANLDPTSRLFTDTEVAPLVITSNRADPDKVAALTAAGARIAVAGDTTVTTAGLLEILADHQFHRVLCEGGPTLVGQLASDSAVDDVCLTTSPHLVAGESRTFTGGAPGTTMAMSPAHILVDDDGTILTRWVRVADE